MIHRGRLITSYLGDVNYQTHLRPAEQGMWGPISEGDPTPTHNIARNPCHTNANTRGRWLKNRINTLKRVVLYGREKIIAEYKPFPIHISIAPTPRPTLSLAPSFIISSPVTLQHSHKYIRLCRVVVKVIGHIGTGAGSRTHARRNGHS